MTEKIADSHSPPPSTARPTITEPIKVFISYAHSDTAFVDRLTEVLRHRGIESWVDRREIPPAADWLRRIVEGIVQARFFIFVVSPRSVTSQVCGVELRQAVGLNKPLVPLLLSQAEMPEALKPVQWCDFSGDEPFEDYVNRLEATLRRDPEWLASHARLAVSSADWDARGKPWYNLLHGAEIKKAEQWLAEANETRPRPTDLQINYVHASRRFSTRWKQVVAAACEDGRVRVWSGRTGMLASELHYSGKAQALTFSPGGRFLVVGGDKGLRTFVISGEDLVTEACRRIPRNFSKSEWTRYVGVGGCRQICPGKGGCDE